MTLPRSFLPSLFLAFTWVTFPLAAPGAEPLRPITDTEKKAVAFLRSRQDPDGSWLKPAGPAVSAMVLKGFVRHGTSIDDPAVRKALAFIDSTRKPDGGWYDASHATYNTSIVLSSLAALPDSAREKYKDQMTAAQTFLKSIQSGATPDSKDDKGAQITRDHPWFGGWGYNQGTVMAARTRPDLSNSHFAIEALHDSGVPASDPSIQNALVFISRLQAAEGNSLPWARGRDDGGFIYAMGWNESHQFYGQSQAPDSKDRNGRDILTTYGSMTYAGLKSLLYADLTRDDPRVKAALRWIAGNYTLELNPGLNSAEGLYYYYQAFGSSLHAYGEPRITDVKGVQHDWRKDLEEKLAKVQQPDGSFVNTASSRWMENDPILATAYVLLALQEARR